MQEMALKGSLSIDVDQIDYGYAWLQLDWLDSLGLPAHLKINFDGWCSREMPIHSGQGPPDIEIVENGVLHFTFAPELARRLELARKVRFEFEAHGQTLMNLHQFLGEPDGAD